MHRNVLLLYMTILLVGTTFALGVSEEAPEKRYLYQWTDDSGHTHITDGLEKVPKEYRSRTKVFDQRATGEEEQPQGEMRAPQETFDLDAEQQAEARRKAEWKARIADARMRMAEAENRLRSAEERLKALQEKWGYGAYGYTPEVQDQIDQLNAAIAQAREDLEQSRDQVENVIPEEARKAGVPPGWLRE